MNDAYPLPPFRVADVDLLCDIMRAYPLATLVTGTAGSCKITLVPLLVDLDAAQEEIVLSGHVDRNNEQVPELEVGAAVSFQFAGPDRYASPDLYPDPQLPGWLYVSVQGDGQVVEELGGDDLRALLVRSTRDFGEPQQRFELSAADARMDRLLPFIHGFRVRVTRVSGIAKLAQDKGATDSEIALNFLADQDCAQSRELFRRLAPLVGKS